MQAASINITGKLNVTVLRRIPFALSLMIIFTQAFPHFGLTRQAFFWRLRNLPHFLPGFFRYLTARLMGVPTFVGVIYGEIIRRNGRVERLGMMSLDIVTSAGVNYIASRMANSSPANIALFNYHALGLGTTAATIADTALVTELTTQYNPDNLRATGVQSNPSANIYQSVATNTVDSAVAITEWGLLTQAAVGGGTLLDRMVFAAVNLISGDSFQTTFQLTLSAGS